MKRGLPFAGATAAAVVEERVEPRGESALLTRQRLLIAMKAALEELVQERPAAATSARSAALAVPSRGTSIVQTSSNCCLAEV